MKTLPRFLLATFLPLIATAQVAVRMDSLSTANFLTNGNKVSIKSGGIYDTNFSASASNYIASLAGGGIPLLNGSGTNTTLVTAKSIETTNLTAHGTINQDGITSLVTISSTNTSIGQNGDNYGIIGAGRFRVLGLRDGTAPLIYFVNSGASGAGISYTNNGLFGGGMGLTFNNDWRLHVSSIRVAVTNALFVPIGGIEAVGSQNDMLSTFTGNSQWHLNGSTAGRAASGDSIFTVYNWSTNANNSGAGIGVVVMGQDVSGNPIVLDAVGSSFNHVPTNRPAGLIPGWSQLVFNSSAAHMKGLAVSSPGTAWGKPDNGNYSLAMFDFPNHLFRVPLQVSGVYQPSQAGWRDAMTVNEETGLTTVSNLTATGTVTATAFSGLGSNAMNNSYSLLATGTNAAWFLNSGANIMAYGAVPNSRAAGEANRLAITTAMSNSASVFIPPGTFFSTPIVLPTTCSNVYGIPGVSVLELADSASAATLLDGSAVRGAKYIGITFRGTNGISFKVISAPVALSGLKANPGGNNIVHQCRFEGFQYGIYGAGTSEASARTPAFIWSENTSSNCQASVNTGDISLSEFGHIINNNFAFGYRGMIVGSAAELISGNQIHDMNDYGILVFTNSSMRTHSLYQGNFIVHNVKAFGVLGGTGVVLKNNVFGGDANAGRIDLLSATNCIVEDNEFLNGGTITITGGLTNYIHRNFFPVGTAVRAGNTSFNSSFWDNRDQSGPIWEGPNNNPYAASFHSTVTAQSITGTNFLAMATNYVAASFAPIVGQVKFAPSNNWIYTVTTLATNPLIQISP